MRYSFFLLLFSSVASAFEDPTQFFVQSTPHAASYGASSEGVYFTGSPRFVSLNCSSCHTDGPGVVRLKLGADHPELFTNGYIPGQTYLFEVELFAESKGLEYSTVGCTEPPGKDDKYTYVQCNSNSFALEVDLAGGPPLSGSNVFCAEAPLNGVCPAPNFTSDEVMVAPDGDAVFAQRQYSDASLQMVRRNDATDWHLWWTAPPAGAGALTIFVAAVDGNGGSGTVANDQDPYGDDTVQASFTIREGGAPAPPGTHAGCDVGATSSRMIDPSLLLVALLVLLRRRKSRPIIA